LGCYSRDQCYFEGAVDILENLDEIDFTLLMSGKLCVDELDLVRDLPIKYDKLKIPKFMKSMQAYKTKLRQIGVINGILGSNRVTLDDEDSNEDELKQYIRTEIHSAKKMPVSLPRRLDNYDENTSTLCNIL
jgi:hypothetical protein